MPKLRFLRKTLPDHASGSSQLTFSDALSGTTYRSTTTYDLLGDEGTDFQQKLWYEVLSEKRLAVLNAVNGITGLSGAVIRNVISTGDEDGEALNAENTLQSLSAVYEHSGYAQRMPRIRQIFMGITPFTSAIAGMAQSNMISSLLWGSLCLVFQSIVRFGAFWDDIRSMLERLSSCLPRFHAYHNILQTPRLHAALRDIYELFLEFCIKVLRTLSGSQMHIFFRLHTSFATDLRGVIQHLSAASAEFEKEVQLANVQKDVERHEAVMAVLRPNGCVTNITFPRNVKFTGRDDILGSLHAMLEPSIADQPENRVACSCLIHAVGGMGKTETILEYTYRYRKSYSYIFWLRSETEQVLLDSFLDAVSDLGIVKGDGLSPNTKLRVALQWFQSTDKPWLIVFDNAEEVSVLQRFWPASTQGAIVVTSQNPRLGILTMNSIHLQPLSVDEGSSLIQNVLQRGGSEKEEARKLSENLGGLPLAITHFAGAIMRSHCPISQISQSFMQRAQTSRVWAMDDEASMARGYHHTLDTVWDFAVARLSSESSQILEFIAFLDPDQIPVQLFIGMPSAGGEEDRTFACRWDIQRFNSAITPLCERHLVDRYQYGTLDALRTHRTLQRGILQRADRDNLKKRDQNFDSVVSLIREAMPAADLIKRDDGALAKGFARCSAHVISLHKNFTQSVPSIPGSMEFAAVLHDYAYHAVHSLGQLRLPLDLLETAEAICAKIGETDANKVRRMRIDILSTMGAILLDFGVDGPRKCIPLLQLVLKLIEEEIDGIPREQWTDTQCFLMARAYDDYGATLIACTEIEEALIWLDKSVDIYRSMGDVLSMALVAINRLLPISVLQRKEQTREEAKSALAIIVEHNGENSPITIRMQRVASGAFFTIGDIEEAFKLLSEVVAKQRVILGPAHHRTLGSQYCLAVYSQHMNQLEEAESILRNIISLGSEADGWSPEVDLRSKLRLCLVLETQRRPTEARKIRAEIEAPLQKLRQKESSANATDEDDMILLDSFASVLHYGRTAGRWSNGNMW